MTIGLVVDSACDLPRDFFHDHGIEIMPISLHFGNERFVDLRDPEATLNFYKDYIPEHGLKAETEAFTVEEISRLFLDQLVTRYDRVLVCAIAGTRSQIFHNATQASFRILKEYHRRREASGLKGNFMLRVVDTGQLFTGEGVLVWELVHQLAQHPEMGLERLRQFAERFKRQVYTYAIPRDLQYIRERGRQRGDRSVGWLQSQLGGLLDVKPIVEAHVGETHPIGKVRHFEAAVDQVMSRAIERIDRGNLVAPVVVLSYAGEIRELHHLEAYRRLRLRADEAQVKLLESMMSTTAGVYLGAGSFSLAYAADR